MVKLSRHVDDDVQVVVVGVSEEQKKNLPRNILAYTRTADVSELQRLYAVADFFINPTHEDNFPSTNVEALSCGTPVITYRTGGSTEAADEKTGRVVDVGDIADLYGQTMSVIPESLCRNRSMKFTPSKAQLQYELLYFKE